MCFLILGGGWLLWGIWCGGRGPQTMHRQGLYGRGRPRLYGMNRPSLDRMHRTRLHRMHRTSLYRMHRTSLYRMHRTCTDSPRTLWATSRSTGGGVCFVLKWPTAVASRPARLFDENGPACLEPRSPSPAQIRAYQRRRVPTARVPTCTTEQSSAKLGAVQTGGGQSIKRT